MPPLRRIVARNVRAVREATGMSRSELGRRIGCTVSYVTFLEEAQRGAMLTTLELLAEALDVDPVYLVQENEAPRARGRR